MHRLGDRNVNGVTEQDYQQHPKNHVSCIMYHASCMQQKTTTREYGWRTIAKNDTAQTGRNEAW